jgi:hypothetical protein
MLSPVWPAKFKAARASSNAIFPSRNNMPNLIQDQLIAGLIRWSLLSLGTATIGLYIGPGEFWRSFWFMSGLWGLIDGGIGWFAMLRERQSPAALLPFVRLNAGLDVLYVVIAGFLLSRKKSMLRVFGLVVLVQKAFLLILESYFLWKCAQAIV